MFDGGGADERLRARLSSLGRPGRKEGGARSWRGHLQEGGGLRGVAVTVAEETFARVVCAGTNRRRTKMRGGGVGGGACCLDE